MEGMPRRSMAVIEQSKSRFAPFDAGVDVMTGTLAQALCYSKPGAKSLATALKTDTLLASFLGSKLLRLKTIHSYTLSRSLHLATVAGFCACQEGPLKLPLGFYHSFLTSV